MQEQSLSLTSSFACQYPLLPVNISSVDLCLFQTQGHNIWNDAFQAIENSLFTSFISFEMTGKEKDKRTFPLPVLYCNKGSDAHG